MKMANGGENLGIRHTNGKLLSIEARSLVQRTDTVFLDFSNLKKQTYQFRFGTQNLPLHSMEIRLIDRYLDQSQMISIGDSTFIDFTINNEPGSADPGRFILVFRNKVRNVTHAPLVESKSGQAIIDEQDSEVQVFPNPVQDGIIRLQFANKKEGAYQLKLVSLNGQLLKQQRITVVNGKMNSCNDECAKGMAAGQYTLHIIEPGGNKISFPLFIQ
ncbi:MAG: T9SS type A sorting domain-containing protein [Ferruginibacter sp.]